MASLSDSFGLQNSHYSGGFNLKAFSPTPQVYDNGLLHACGHFSTYQAVMQHFESPLFFVDTCPRDSSLRFGGLAFLTPLPTFELKIKI